jgi:D-glycero-beta-D-manno-heptose 1-phosphate adenylyltransferase
MNHRLDIIQGKILSGKELDRWLAITRFRNRKIVFTNGCFDVLHRGHVDYLARASELGDQLVVGLNTDNSVKRLKGADRPYLDEGARALILAALGFVSVVVLFDEDTPYELIRHIQPDVLVKGGEYRIEEIVGHDLVSSRGGKVLTIEMTAGYSSTGVIGKLSGSS